MTNLVLFYFNSGQTEPQYLNYGWNLLIFLAGVAQQGQEIAPSPITARIIFIYMMVASVVLFETFNASYTSFLSVVKIFNPFQTLADLEQTSFIIGAQELTAYRSMFIVSENQALIFIIKTKNISASSERGDGETGRLCEGRWEV